MPDKTTPSQRNFRTNVAPHPHTSIIQPSNANPNYYSQPIFSKPDYVITAGHGPEGIGVTAPTPTNPKSIFDRLPSLAITIQH